MYLKKGSDYPMHDNINTDNISFVEAESNEETATVWLVALVVCKP